MESYHGITGLCGTRWSVHCRKKRNMALSLFPTNPGVGNSAPVFQLRAGKCQLSAQQNGKFRVTPDLRRGNLVLTYESDRLLHFKWVNLSTQVVEDDRIVMPGDCVFKKVKTGREGDRVYQLHFPRATASHLLFWLQDKASEKDEENVKRLNEQLNKQAPTSRPLAVPSSSQQVRLALLLLMPCADLLYTL